jgi:hypothetical protein
MSAPKQSPDRKELDADMKRAIGDGRTARFLHKMPVFKVVTDMPDYLGQLLDRLEECETPARSQRRR